jgi:hypothetical protein
VGAANAFNFTVQLDPKLQRQISPRQLLRLLALRPYLVWPC